MALRPARTFRDAMKVAWSRYSKKKPRKSYVKSMPHNALIHFRMGNPDGEYDRRLDLIVTEKVQVRDNALEAARQSINKYLEKNIPNQYFFRIYVFPHNVIRENKMIAGAGADRLQSGMAHPFGRPTERGAVLKPGQRIFSIFTKEEHVDKAKEAYRRAKVKMSGRYKVKVSEFKGKASAA